MKDGAMHLGAQSVFVFSTREGWEEEERGNQSVRGVLFGSNFLQDMIEEGGKGRMQGPRVRVFLSLLFEGRNATLSL